MSAQPAGAITDDSAPPLSNAAFDRISKRIYAKSGIVLATHKKQMAQARIARRLCALGLTSFESYLEFLDSPEGGDEQSAFVEALTTNLTSFFRESHHFDHLKTVLLPQISANANSRARFWSAACSTGEEPYSMACVVKGLLETRPDLDLKILATDIDTQVLKKASDGVYPSDRVRDLEPEYINYFRGMITEEKLKISQDLKRFIVFRNLNLFAQWPFHGSFDAIFCRNVIIYFEADERKLLIGRMVERLRPGGYLYLGHSEALIEQHEKLSNEGHTIYRKLP